MAGLPRPWRAASERGPADEHKAPLCKNIDGHRTLFAARFYVLPHLGFSLTTINRILIWGLFRARFRSRPQLSGYAGLLSFGQSAFFGTGGMFAAFLLTEGNFPYVLTSIVAGSLVAGIVGYLVGLIALRRTGIYFAMITVAIAEVFFFVEFNPLSAFTGGER